MKSTTLLLTIALACTAGCDESTPATAKPKPKAYIAAEDRVPNYTRRGEGSCAVASAATLKRAQGDNKTAGLLTRKYGGGQYAGSMRTIMRAEGIPYRECRSGSLQWLRTTLNRGYKAGVAYPRGHCQVAYRIDAKYIYLVDNNGAYNPRGVPIEKFKRGWMGWAFALP